MRDEAIDALVAVRDELRKPERRSRCRRDLRAAPGRDTARRRDARADRAARRAAGARRADPRRLLLASAAIALAALDAHPAQRIDTMLQSSQFEHALTRRTEQPTPSGRARAHRAGDHARHVERGPLRTTGSRRCCARRRRRASASPSSTARTLRAPGSADDAWELLRPDRPAPHDRNGPGVPFAASGRSSTTLERL